MIFTTPVTPEKSSFKINHSMRGLVLGSCFSQEMGAKLANLIFPISLNPHGILFNPASIGLAFQDIISRRGYNLGDLVNHNGLWHSMQHHGSFSASTPEKTLEAINTPVESYFDYIIITLGTAWIYQYKGTAVANCHKLPSAEFVRKRLCVAECVESLAPLIKYGKPVIITVSPVRHIKDGLAENSLSKSILRLSAAELAENNANVSYFPSYEIMLDELRDYRYYADDMLHPSAIAVEYIWRKFASAHFDPATNELCTRIAKIQSSLAHRPLHQDTAEYDKFRNWLLQAMKQLASEHPEIDFSKELKHFQQR